MRFCCFKNISFQVVWGTKFSGDFFVLNLILTGLFLPFCFWYHQIQSRVLYTERPMMTCPTPWPCSFPQLMWSKLKAEMATQKSCSFPRRVSCHEANPNIARVLFWGKKIVVLKTSHFFSAFYEPMGTSITPIVSSRLHPKNVWVFSISAILTASPNFLYHISCSIPTRHHLSYSNINPNITWFIPNSY